MARLWPSDFTNVSLSLLNYKMELIKTATSQSCEVKSTTSQLSTWHKPNTVNSQRLTVSLRSSSWMREDERYFLSVSLMLKLLQSLLLGESKKARERRKEEVLYR